MPSYWELQRRTTFHYTEINKIDVLCEYLSVYIQFGVNVLSPAVHLITLTCLDVSVLTRSEALDKLTPGEKGLKTLLSESLEV